MPSIEAELAEAAAAGRILNRGGVWHARGLPSVPPEPDDRSLSNVEGAAGRLRQLLRRREDREQILADTHRATGGRLGDLIQLAVGPVV